jgi:hypothetical protein
VSETGSVSRVASEDMGRQKTRQSEGELARRALQVVGASKEARQVAGTEQILAEGLAEQIVSPAWTADNRPPLAFLVVTPRRLVWRLIANGSPVLSLSFEDVRSITVAENATGIIVRVCLTYRPSGFPDSMRDVNPSGELDAEFLFSANDAGARLRKCILDLADASVQAKRPGDVLATGEGYLEGILASEQIYVSLVEAHERAIVIHRSGEPPEVIPYSAAEWFSVSVLPARLTAPRLLQTSDRVVTLSLTEGGVVGRWRLVVKPDDLEKWRVILAYFGTRDASPPDSA